MSENNNRLDRMMGQMQQFDTNEAADFITDMMTQITEPPKRIPENVFREIFLPVFAGLDPDMEKRTAEFTAHWAGVVGSPMEPAEIVDVQGNKLFVVPPLYDSSKLNTEEQGFGVNSYRHIFGSLVDTSAINPQAAAGEYVTAVSKRLDGLIKEPTPAKNPWEEVFSFYNLIKKSDDVQSPTTGPASDNLDDDFVFDE